jgi:hypothetical protein
VGAGRDPPRAEVPVSRNINASTALHGKIETEPLAVELHPVKIEPLPPGIEVIGAF